MDTRRPIADGTYPVALRVARGRNDNRKFGLEFYFTKAEFQKLIAASTQEPYKDFWLALLSEQKRADDIIKEMNPFFDLRAFGERFRSVSGVSMAAVFEPSTLRHVLELAKIKYRKLKQFPMAALVEQAVSAILRYANHKRGGGRIAKASERITNLPLRVITPEFCRDFEDWMVKKSKTNSVNGAGIYMRHIRILYNLAITKKLVPSDWYPFKRVVAESSIHEDLYTIPSERKSRDYLTPAEILSLASADCLDTEWEKRGQFAWLASFFCNGANAADILKFKYSNIEGNFIHFYREKIKSSSRVDRRLVKIFITPELRKLIQEHGNPPSPGNYIFPIYTNEMDEEEKLAARKAFLSSATKAMKVIAPKIGIQKNLRFGNARHSTGAILKNNKVSRDFIKDYYGHLSITTADNYMDSFDDDEFETIANQFTSLDALKKRK